MRTAIITGASGGIGYQTSLAFVKAGYAVVAVYNSNEASAKKLAEEAQKSYNGIVYPVKIDLASSKSISDRIKEILSEFKSIDVLVNNAGVSYVGLLQDTSEQDYDRVFNVNMKSAFLLTKAVLPSMIEKKHGKIVNVSSMWGERGASCEVVYSASKAALVGFTKALAKEVGPSGINVNTVLPGVIDTKMNSRLTPEDIEELKDSTAMGRIGTPEEIAELILYLCSEKSSFITGQAIAADGGFIG